MFFGAHSCSTILGGPILQRPCSDRLVKGLTWTRLAKEISGQEDNAEHPAFPKGQQTVDWPPLFKVQNNIKTVHYGIWIRLLIHDRY